MICINCSFFPAFATPSSLTSLISRIVKLPFWYQLTHVVLRKAVKLIVVVVVDYSEFGGHS